MTVAALPPQTLYEITQTHADTGRVNLVCWDLLEPEARRVLSELEDNQRARQGKVLVSGKPESGWTFAARPPLPTPVGLRRRTATGGRA